MLTRFIVTQAAVCGLAVTAQANDLTVPIVPTFAMDPQSLNPRTFDSPTTSPWSGFYIGSEITGISRKGVKGLFGGSAMAGYNHEFSSKIVLGAETSAGFAPNIFAHSSTPGYDFAATRFKVGYDMGRLMPFLTAGVTLAKPTADSNMGFVSATDSVNNLFSSSSHVKTFGSIGAGFDYAFSNNLSIGIAVSANKGAGFPAWP